MAHLARVACLASLATVMNAAELAPNVLFIIADDASHFGATGCAWVKTPHIDRLAQRGLVFDNAYTPTGKCAPSRAAILTGRNPWQLEDAGNHQSYFPAKFKAFSEALLDAGITVGAQGKVWGPGVAETADGQKRTFGFQDVKGKTPGNAFAGFLKTRDTSKPFFYWFGSHYPHRAYKEGLDHGGLKPSDVDHQVTLTLLKP